MTTAVTTSRGRPSPEAIYQQALDFDRTRTFPSENQEMSEITTIGVDVLTPEEFATERMYDAMGVDPPAAIQDKLRRIADAIQQNGLALGRKPNESARATPWSAVTMQWNHKHKQMEQVEA